VRLVETDAIVQSRDRVKMLAASASYRQRDVVSKRSPDIRRAACIGEQTRLEVFWQNAYDFKGNLIQQDGLADCIRIPAKTVDPIGITEQRHMPAVGSVLLAQQSATKIGRSAENVKKVLRDSQAINNFGSAAARR
jgi:hypothetical protein